MGNYKFKLSDMIPNAWFYKLKDMGKNKTKGYSHTTSTSSSYSSYSYSSSGLQSNQKTQPHHHLSYQRKSYYISRNLSPVNNNHETFSNTSKKRRSTTKRSRTCPKLVTSSISASCSCRASLESVRTKPDSTPEQYPNSPNSSPSSEQESTLDPMISLSPSCGCRVDHDDNIVIDMTKDTKIHDLPPIITKHEKFNKKEKQPPRISTTMRRVSVTSANGVKLRTNSPRMTNSRRIQGNRKTTVSSRRTSTSSVSESFAVMKSSKDPQKDFRESMVEMILENNIRASKDLEELLAAYLSLNSDEYHELIIKVFKQIWFDMTDNRLK